MNPRTLVKKLPLFLVLSLAALAAFWLWLSLSSEGGAPVEQVQERGEASPQLAERQTVAEGRSESFLSDTPAESGAAAEREAFDAGLELVEVQALPAEESGHGHSLGSWLAALRPAPRDWSRQGDALRFGLTTPDGERHGLLLDVSQEYGPGKGLFAGSVEGSAFSEVIVSYVGDAVSGVIRLPELGVSWELRNKGEGIVEFEKVDLSKLKECAACRAKE